MTDDIKYLEGVCEVIPMTDVQLAVYELLMKAPPEVKHRIRSSIQGIMKAWGLKDLDSNMACFRIITAQEEAECAIIHSLKRRNYSNSEKLNPHNHVHKASIFYIISTVAGLLPMMNGVVEWNFSIEQDEKLGESTPNIRFRFIGSEDERYYYPVPPLNLQIKKGEEENKALHDLGVEINKLTTRKGYKNFQKFLKDDANIRNDILYASNQGVPHVSMDVRGFIRAKTKYIYFLHVVCLLIDFYREKQLLVQQILDILVKNLKSTKCAG